MSCPSTISSKHFYEQSFVESDRKNSSIQNFSHRPLLVSSIIGAKHLIEIFNKLQDWSKESSTIGGPDTSRYREIVRNIREIVSERLNSYSESPVKKEESKKNKKYIILAAYDQDGNLQGVEVIHEKKRNQDVVAMKVDWLISSIYNMDFFPLENPTRTRGTGTCLLTRALEMLPKNTLLYLDPLGKSYKFYTHLGFCESSTYPNYLAFSTNELSKLQLKTKGQLQPLFSKT